MICDASHFSGDDATEAVYLPTPEEIAAACLEIQSTWSDDERAVRRGGYLREDTRRINAKGVEQFARESIADTLAQRRSAIVGQVTDAMDDDAEPAECQ